MVWWVVLVCLLLLFIPQTVIHEGSHALMVKAYGGTITKFWPLPGWSSGKFLFGYVRWNAGTCCIPSTHVANISVAPVVVNMLFMVILSIVNILVSDTLTMSCMFAFMLTNFVDGANNCRRVLVTSNAMFPLLNSDLADWGKMRGSKPSSVKRLALIWLGAGSILIPLFLYVQTR